MSILGRTFIASALDRNRLASSYLPLFPAFCSVYSTHLCSNLSGQAVSLLINQWNQQIDIWHSHINSQCSQPLSPQYTHFTIRGQDQCMKEGIQYLTLWIQVAFRNIMLSNVCPFSWFILWLNTIPVCIYFAFHYPFTYRWTSRLIPFPYNCG